MTGRTPAQTLAIGGGAILSAVLVGIGGFKAVDVTTAHTLHRYTTYAQPIRHVVIETASDQVEIRGSAGSTTTVDSTIREAVTRANPHASVEGDTLRLTGGCSGFAIASCSVRYVINVPSTSDITAHTSSGSLTVSTMQADVSLSAGAGEVVASNITGRVSLSTQVGQIVADKVSGGPLSLRTNSGSITADNISADRVTAQNQTGNIGIDMSSAPLAVSAHTAAGSVQISVPRDHTRYHLKLHSDAGREFVDGVTDDPTSSRILDADTSSGRINIAYAD
jgi:DUF4097 and DUF4098 domain-containing protein YvlB